MCCHMLPHASNPTAIQVPHVSDLHVWSSTASLMLPLFYSRPVVLFSTRVEGCRRLMSARYASETDRAQRQLTKSHHTGQSFHEGFSGLPLPVSLLKCGAGGLL